MQKQADDTGITISVTIAKNLKEGEEAALSPIIFTDEQRVM